jgi:hypothetical protein
MTMNCTKLALAVIQRHNHAFWTCKAMENATKHTAISGLSSRTYSCGGEGALFGRCGDASISTLGAACGLGTFEKNLRIPSFLVNSISSSEGTDDRSDRSEESSDMMVVVWLSRFG